MLKSLTKIKNKGGLLILKLLKKMRNKKGFTLVELMVVVVIIGILVAIAIPVYNSAQTTARTNACKANLRIMNGAIQTAITSGDTATSIADLVPKYIATTPTCPSGVADTYTFVAATVTPATAAHVTCKQPDHTLP